MTLSAIFGEMEELNEHQIAWKSRDWDSVKKLADSFKTDPENEFRDIMNRINSNKSRLHADAYESYSMYSINNVLSAHVDCMYHVYNMNLLGDSISEQMHFDYLLHSVRPAKRYGSVSVVADQTTALVNETFILAISRTYEVSRERAKEYFSGFTQDEIDYIMKLLSRTITEDMVKTACPHIKNVDVKKVLKVIENLNK